ncbi:DNA primase family protein [Lactovum odontotermitis]
MSETEMRALPAGLEEAQEAEAKEKAQMIDPLEKELFHGSTFRNNETGEEFHLPVLTKLNSIKEIKTMFKEWRKAYFKFSEADAKNEKKSPPKSLQPLTVAKVIMRVMYVIRLESEIGHVAIYNPENGLYVPTDGFIHKVIYWLEPTFNIQKSKEVIFKLETLARVKESTNSMYLIHVKNGIFDKKRQELLPFSPQYIFTSTIATAYRKNEKLPIIDGWDVDGWLLDLVGGDEELNQSLWEIISASTSSACSYRKGVWLLGAGNDGKGTFQELIMNLIGFENVETMLAEDFQKNFALENLPGKTVIIGDDSQAKYLDNASNYFSAVTGDNLTIEPKGKARYSFKFKGLVIQSANFLPTFRNKSNGLYRRMLIIPFMKKFTADNDNWKIKDDYITRPEVLEYVLVKALSLNFERLIEPKASLAQLEQFKEDNDNVLAFVNEWLPQFESNFLPTSFLFWFYKAQISYNGQRANSYREFSKALTNCLPDNWVRSTQRLKGKFVSRDIEKARRFRTSEFSFTDEELLSSHKGILRKI